MHYFSDISYHPVVVALCAVPGIYLAPLLNPFITLAFIELMQQRKQLCGSVFNSSSCNHSDHLQLTSGGFACWALSRSRIRSSFLE